MGSYFSNFKFKYTGQRKLRMLMLGLDAAGKSTILCRLNNSTGVTRTIPSIGFNVEILEIAGFNFTIWDFGGCKRMIMLLKHYSKIEGLIFVVDCNDKERIYEAAEGLKKILLEDELKDCPLLVFANKQDLSNVISPNEIVDIFGLRDIKRPWSVLGT